MSPMRSPTLRDLHANRHALPAPRPSRRAVRAWIEEDPDLAPAPRRECPLSVWA